MPEQLPPQYDPKQTEGRIYRWWADQELFAARPESGKKPYTILMPPPNVTGELHVGHALFVTLQDILTRWKRMQGFDALWVPGTDHAGIATQMIVERQLREEQGLSRHDLGRVAFLDLIWASKERYANRINEQIRTLGASPDWSREFFTLDEDRSRAVTEVFVRLYEEGLIYRSTRLINWCPQDRTALSDLEVEHEEGSRGELWSFAYPLAGGEGEIVVATTRPETMLGDTAIAVHPDDERYRALVGRTVRHPILDRDIPVIADAELVDPDFGTGAVKVTPAHDFNDFAVGERHGLESINILNPDGTLNDAGGPFSGMDRFEARKAVKAKLEELGLFRGAREHELPLGRCQRCGAVVEPYLSLQWFVKIAPLAAPAIAAVEKGETVFVPESWTKTYMAWMTNIHDWTISRQLWWGHRIPAWYAEDGSVFVARDSQEALAKARNHFGRDVQLEQDPDVLDTWFSSGLLPFTALGWPEQTRELERYYPGTVMETGYDIIFFWVARMMMMGLHFMGEVPFRTVYLHAMVRDEKGQKMSKTKGNVIDPLVVSEEYGADALRFTLAASSAQGRNINLSLDRVAGYQAFANKLWNVARFALMHLEQEQTRALPELGRLELADRWIVTRLAAVTVEVTEALDRFRLQDAANAIYAFLWGELADWYLELVKPRLYGDAGESSQQAARATLAVVLDGALRLLHPFMPFITEEVWQRLPRSAGDPPALMVANWPQSAWYPRDADAVSEVAEMQAVIAAVRTLRAEYGVQPARLVELRVAGEPASLRRTLSASGDALRTLARVESVAFSGANGDVGASAVLASGAVLFLPLASAIDLDRERERLAAELDRLSQQAAGAERKLGNDHFVQRAPEDVVARERDKLHSFREQAAKVAEKLQVLGADG